VKPYFVIIVAVTSSILGCATPVPAGEQMTIVGTIKDRYEVAARPKHSVNESHTLGTFGAMGMLMARLMGEPGHFSYKLETTNGAFVQVANKTSFELGACVRVTGPRAELEGYSGLGSSKMELATGC
jgi:hypothetical protein